MRTILIICMTLALLAPAAIAQEPMKQKEVPLTWQASPEPDLNAYNLYYDFQPIVGPGPPTADVKPQFGPITIRVPEDRSAPVQHPYTVEVPPGTEGTIYFVVTAVDTSGNESGYSNTHEEPYDFLAPAPPVGLAKDL